MEDILVAHPDVNVVITESDTHWVLLKDCSGWKTNDILMQLQVRSKKKQSNTLWILISRGCTP
jgi:phage pi2 protein 07